MYPTGYNSRTNVEQAEGFGLERGGDGKDIGGHGSLCHGQNPVAGERGEVGQKGLEAMNRQAVWSAFSARLGTGGGRGPSRHDR